MLGFPFLRMDEVQEAEISVHENQEEIYEESSLSHSSVDMNVQVWRVGSVLAPQDMSLMIRLDLAKRAVSLRLRNSNGEGRFMWQDWVDAAMGCIKGVEKSYNERMGFGRKIVRPDLHKPIIEFCPLRVEEHGIEAVVKKTKTARVWKAWSMFDARICKFEIEQWFAACDVRMNGDLEHRERREAEYEVDQAVRVIRKIIFAENEEVNGSVVE